MHGLNSLKRNGSRIGVLFTLVFVFALTANAYTVVMRGGRRVEIPSRFVLTESTLTYEVSPGVQVTIAVAAINISATEKANNERPGSLMKRVQSASLESQESAERSIQPMQAKRTITNRDLESSMRRRRDSEVAYENRRKQLGLPSVEESRKQAAAEAELIGMELEQRRIAENESESYWRERAAALRTEMAALDAELAYVRSRLEEGPLPLGWSGGWSGLAFNTITSGVPFGNFGHRQFGNFGGRPGFPTGLPHRPSVFVAPNSGTRIVGRVAPGGGVSRAQVFPSPGPFRHGPPFGVAGRFSGFPGVAIFGSTIPAYDYSYERSELITRFNELAATRAGLNARWRELEDEARRAGAPPGWLRK